MQEQDAAADVAERSAELVALWSQLGEVARRGAKWDDASQAYRSALALHDGWSLAPQGSAALLNCLGAVARAAGR